MRMINIRSVRGEDLKRSAHAGELVGVLKNRSMIGIIVPVTPHWVAHVVEHNWSRVLQSVTEGERTLDEGTPMVTLDDVLAERGASDAPVEKLPAESLPRFLASIGAVPSDDSDLPPARTVRVGDLSAKLVEQAGEAEEMLALTHDGVLLGIVVPVTERLTAYLVGKNMSRVLFNISYGEKEAASEEPLAAIEQVLTGHGDQAHRRAGNGRQPHRLAGEAERSRASCIR